jgi:hypothetical protein
VYSYRMFVDDLDSFIESVPPDLQIIPEVGIQTSDSLEVLVTVMSEEGFGAGGQCELESNAIPGLRVKIGPQSDLFEKCLDEITSYDTGDYGHDHSLTLRISPGPPYSTGQRRELQFLMSRLCGSIGAALRFWSVSFEPLGSPECGPLDKLRTTVETSPFDKDRVCLALVNNIASDVEPSKFVNAFRLLETIVKRVLEERIRRVRFEKTVDQNSFLDLVRLLQSDLKTRLREAIRCKSDDPAPILKELWRVLQPGRKYNPDEVFDQIVKVRNRSVHSPAEADEAILFPWESKPLGKIAEQVLELANFLLKRERRRRARSPRLAPVESA